MAALLRGWHQSIVEAEPKLNEEFPRIQIVRAAERKAVVQQHAAVGDIYPLNVDGKSLAKTLAESKIEGRVELEMVSGIGS